jgi:hypothetical protein
LPEITDRVLFLLEELHASAVSLRQLWLLHQQLYGQREHVDLMRKTALVSFGLIQQLLREAIFLGIQRFLDPASMGRYKTASLEQLLLSIPPGHEPLCEGLQQDLIDIRTTSVDIKEWRDRQIAHLDYKTVFLEHPTPLNDVMVRTTQTSIDGIVNFLRQVAEHLYSRQHVFSFQGEPLDGDTLMFFLEKGLKQHPPIRYPTAEP